MPGFCLRQIQAGLCPKSILITLLLWLLVLPGPAHAHFKLNLNIRIFHISHHSDGVDVYLRLPMPYLVASLLGPVQADGNRKAAPYTTNATVDGELMHFLDLVALQADASGLGLLAAQGHVLEVRGSRFQPTVEKVLVYSGIEQPPFSTLQEARRSMSNEQSAYNPAPYVGDTVVDVLLRYNIGKSISTYTLASTLNPDLPGQMDTANLILDYKDGTPSVYRITGLLSEPVTIDRSQWTAARSFIVNGIEHILEGFDHVLFVLCLIIGAVSLASLAWRVTGFTIGHSVTLSLGFFGLTPSGQWFVPLVETGIAVSIILAALFAINRSDETTDNAGFAFVGTIVLGLLHGLGFSFILREILGVDSSNIWISLLSFNIGVELGQLLIVLLIWPVLSVMNSLKPAWNPTIRWLIAVPCIAVAAVWTGQRGMAFLAALASSS